MTKEQLEHLVEWDRALSWNDRYFHACPICGIGVTSPIGGPMMAHKACLEEISGNIES